MYNLHVKCPVFLKYASFPQPVSIFVVECWESVKIMCLGIVALLLSWASTLKLCSACQFSSKQGQSLFIYILSEKLHEKLTNRHKSTLNYSINIGR